MLASADNPLGAIPGFNHPKEDFQTVRDVSVIFPAFNEEGNIRCTVETVIRGPPQGAVKWEGIFFGGGNNGVTALVRDALKAQFPEDEVICHEQNSGHSARIKNGVTY